MGEFTQRCGACKQHKPLEDYSPSKRGQAGAQCKPCNNAARRQDKSSISKAPHESLQCTYCGKWYVPKQLKKNPKYCSRQCWLDERKAISEAKRLAKACCLDGSCYLHHQVQRCGHCKQLKPLVEFNPSHRGIVGHWCHPCHNSVYVQGKELPVADHDPQQCVQCEKWYIPTNLYEKRNRPSKYCSDTCNQAAKSDRRRAKLVVIRANRDDLICQYCGGRIPPEMVNNDLFCSTECCHRADQLRRKMVGRVRMDTSVIRHLFAEICTRDKWICQLCYESVDKAVKHPNPMCPSLDHVIQVHWGGTNDPDNLRLTHLVCNQRRPRKRDLDIPV